MDQELYKQAEAFYEKIGDLNKSIAHCDILLKEIEHGADLRVMGHNYNLNMNECNLDNAQKQLLSQLLTGIIKNRMEEAERELRSLLPPGSDDTETMPRRARRHV